MIPGPQVVKTNIRPSETLSPIAKQSALALHGLIANNEGPAVWTAQRMHLHEVTALLLCTASQVHAGRSGGDRRRTVIPRTRPKSPISSSNAHSLRVGIPVAPAPGTPGPP